MVTEIILPKLGQTMEEGSIVEWLKKEGDPIKRDEVIFTVESDKATLEVEAKSRGFLRKILVPAGETVPVLTAVALMTRTADESLEGYQGAGAPDSVGLEGPRAQKVESQTLSTESETVEPAPSKAGGGRRFVSPRARMRAEERGVDLARVTGSGPNGRIVERDVLAYLASRPKATPTATRAAEALGVDVTTVRGSGVSGRVMKADVKAATLPAESPEMMAAEPLAGLRRIIAERMATSARETARVTLVTEVEATGLVEAREQLKAAVAEAWGFAPGYNDLLGLVVARALREFPYMNARLSADGQSIERLPEVNLGMAVDTARGLLVPVIRDAGRKGLRAFGAEFRALVERARVGRSLPDDLSGGTFTVTNLGMHEVDAFTPVINLPEAAILGVGRIQPKAVVRDGEIVARQMMTLSLVFDHRLVDGTPAARFLQRIKQLIENPYLLLG
jgi:pyruvate dehydrogenase E2 component (dihydrolipoamide acetyltransferase)